MTRGRGRPGAGNVQDVGEHVEHLLGQLHATGDAKVAAAADELVRVLVELYGQGLAHVMELAAQHPGVAEQLADDPLVESLLLVHDLHPVDVDTRVQRALDEVRPYLGSHAGGVEYLGIDGEGVVQLRLEGSCHGCPSSTVTVRLSVEQAVREAAPETTGVRVEGLVEEVPSAGLLQIGRRPPEAPTRRPYAGVDGDGWAHLPVPDGSAQRGLSLGGTPVLLCVVDGTPYAYRDECPECGSSLVDGALAGAAIACPGCGRHYDVRLAGAGLDDPSRHLQPLPLLPDLDGDGLRIAVGAT